MGFGLVFFPTVFDLIYVHVRYIHIENSSSRCDIVELDTFPGIWRMEADLMCELDSFFYFFSMGKWGLQAWLGVQERKDKELSARSMKSATL